MREHGKNKEGKEKIKTNEPGVTVDKIKKK